MKYIDFESWTITWLHEGNVIVEPSCSQVMVQLSKSMYFILILLTRALLDLWIFHHLLGGGV